MVLCVCVMYNDSLWTRHRRHWLAPPGFIIPPPAPLLRVDIFARTSEQSTGGITVVMRTSGQNMVSKLDIPRLVSRNLGSVLLLPECDNLL